MKVMVTGADGFLGKELVLALAQRGDDAIAFDLKFDNLANRLSSNIKLVSGDVTDLANVSQAIKKHRPQAIIHCAALVGALTAYQSPSAVMNVNLGGTLNVLEAMRLFDVPRMIHISTDDVYGPSNLPMIGETHPIDPTMPYGASKAAVEHFSRAYRSLYGLEVIHLRTAWIYGVGLPRARVPKILVEAALEGRELHLETGGDTTLDQTYVPDFVAGALGALDHRDHQFDVYNIASGSAPRLADVVSWINELIPDARLSIGQGNYRYGGQIELQPRSALDITRARTAFGYRPAHDLKTGLQAYIAEMRELHR